MQAGPGASDLAGDERKRDQATRVVGAVGVLGDAHAPEDDRRLGAGELARHRAQHLGVDAADRRHLLRRKILHGVGELLEALDIGLDVLLVVELLVDDGAQDAVEHRDVGAVLELQHVRRVALERLPARIHDDEFGASLRRLLEEGRGDRVVLGRVGTDDHDDVRVLALVEGRRHRAGAGAHQLLEEVGLLVRALGGAEAGEPLRPVAIADLADAGGGAVERFVPGRFAEMRPWVERVDMLVRDLRHAVLADHRLQEALRIVHVVEAEAALHAQAVLVRGAVLAGDLDDLVILDVIGELAADAAVRAHAVDRAVGLALVDVVLVDHGRRHQRAGRTGLHALAAGDAGRGAHRIVEVEDDLLQMAAAGHADHVIDLHLAAGADTKIALDAGVEVDRHGDVAAVGRRHGLGLAFGEAPIGDVLALDGLPELGVGIVRDLDGGLVGEEKLGDHLARGLGAVGLRLHLHAGRRRANAACGEHALALDLDHADAAVAVGAVAGLGRVAQVRQLDVEAAGGAEDRLARPDVDLAVVDEEGLRRRRSTLARDLVDWRSVGDAGLAVAGRWTTRGTLLVVTVTGRFLGFAHGLTLSITRRPNGFVNPSDKCSIRMLAGCGRRLHFFTISGTN